MNSKKQGDLMEINKKIRKRAGIRLRGTEAAALREPMFLIARLNLKINPNGYYIGSFYPFGAQAPGDLLPGQPKLITDVIVKVHQAIPTFLF